MSIIGIKSLSTKFALAIAISISIVLIANAVYLEGQQRGELKQAIAEQAIGYAKLGHVAIGENYTIYYKSGFLNLLNTIKDQLELNRDVIRIQIASYTGEVLLTDNDDHPRYLEEEKQFLPKHLLPKIQGRFDKTDSVSEITLTASELKEIKLDPALSGQPLLEIIYPYYDANQRHVATFRYIFSFANLQIAITRMRLAVTGLTLISILLGILFAIFFASGIIRPIRALTAATKKIAAGDFQLSIKTKLKDEVGQLAASFNQMATQLDQATKELIEKETIAKELQLAAKIQIDTLPKQLPPIPGATLASALTPASLVGGDCYDCIVTPDNKVIFYIGDATGHGVPAGIVISLLNAVIFDHAKHGLALKEILSRANEVIRSKTSGHTFTTVILAEWDPKAGTVEYVSAGHPPLIHYQHKSGTAKTDKTSSGMPIGSLPNLEQMLHVEKIQLASGDSVVIYSDGLIEARNESGQMWGTIQLRHSLEEHAKSAPDAAHIQAGILKDLLAFRGAATVEDDITLLTLRRD